MHEILHQVQILQRNHITARFDWVPGHEPNSTGNQAAHAAAQECALTQTPLVTAEEPSRSPTPPPSLRIHRYKVDRRKRLKTLMPTGYLTNLPPLPRSGQIFINKFITNTAYTPETIRKWYTPHLPPRCPYCHSSLPADLHHLVWECPSFNRHRTFTAPNPQPDPSLLDTALLVQIATYSLKSGLARLV